MLKLPDDEHSYWKDTISKSSYPVIEHDIEVDTVIIGGGITGLTAAYLLKESGQTVAVLEKNTIGSGTTGGTTGKVTSQHGLMYAELSERLGKKTALIYAESNQAALKQIAYIITKEKIACQWETEDNYVYTAQSKNIEKFKSEAKVALDLGLPASFEDQLPLPFKIKAAVKFANQAKFHAPNYTKGLAAAVNGSGSYVFEHSNATGISDGSPCQVKSGHATITAKNIIVATKMPTAPLIARAACAIVEYPQTSYIVAGKLDSPMKGMYISPDKGHYSLLPVTDGNQQLLLIGGEKHIPGLGSPSKRFKKLANYAQEHFGISSISYKWKAMDYLAYDELPLIGKMYPWSKHMYTATGFKKWGLSTSMVAGNILRDLILGQQNPWAEVFDSTRLRPITSIPHAAIKYIKS
ncbi:FAD-binding oxidoreductase [Candidatus Saccharibacteria bacterium]|nr:FAD-binding oxidoreductase [Candidatus Saccharibacteria bacterium]